MATPPLSSLQAFLAVARRLRFAAKLTAILDMEFGEEAARRRLSYHERRAQDPSLGMHGFAVMAGPEMLPPDVFTDAFQQRVLNGH